MERQQIVAVCIIAIILVSLVAVVAINPPQKFAKLADVSFVGLTNGQVPVYNATSGNWSNSFVNGTALNMTLNQLYNVLISGIQNNQIIQYNATSGYWENRDPETYVSSMANITDVSLIGLTDGQILKYNSTSLKWENQDETTWAISTLTDVSLNGLGDLQILQYNVTSGKWENRAIPAQALAGLTDVSINSLSNNQILQYNSTSEKWENMNLQTWAISTLTDVSIVGLSNGQILTYNDTSSKWVNQNSPNGTYVSANPPWHDANLVGYWQMNEGSGGFVYDDSGNANTGTIGGAAWVDGKYYKALDFDGVSDYVDVAGLNFPSTVSVSFWVKRSSSGAYQGIISKYVSLADAYFSIYINYEWFVVEFSDNGTEHYTIRSCPAPSVGEWSFVVFDYSNVTMQYDLYINNILQFEQNWQYGLGNNPYMLRFAYFWAGYFNGSLDDVRVYDKVLTSSERSVLYFGGLQSYAGQLWLNTTSNVLYVRNNNNSAWNFVSAPIHGFSVTTPSFPASETDITNTNPFPVRIYILTVGTTTAYNITDTFGTMMNVTTTLNAGMEITLDCLEKIRFTYSVAPTWKWYGAG